MVDRLFDFVLRLPQLGTEFLESGALFLDRVDAGLRLERL